MANYGPPGGSPEPWGGRRTDDRYGTPAEPYGRGEPGQSPQPAVVPGQPVPPPAGQPAYQPYGQYPTEPYGPGYPTAGPDAYPGNPTPKRGRGTLVAVLAVLAVLLVGGAGTLWYLLGRDDDPASTAGPALPTAPPEPSAATPEPASTTPAPASSADPRFVKAGQCVRNEGPAGGKPKLLITECAPKTYEVLRRFDGATSGERDAEAKCGKVEGYTNWYFFDSELDTLDFVLCLKQR
ncbi:flagellar basal body protein FliL [Micromonospora sp. NPDC092111]|uniref:LppU/SCO3897 family protein n=1 Tax=Micromonospora sp. NPDC092111 TaxID=3364289 RepID=UPI00382B20CF